MESSLPEVSGILSATFIGLIIGLRHSTDGDHIVAVSTMARDYRSISKGLWIGVSWGLGHSTPLFFLGILVLFIKESLMEIYASIDIYFEFTVAIMLVFLGAQVFWKMSRKEFHVHEHEHEDSRHKHIHGSHRHALGIETNPHAVQRHGLLPELFPFFRVKSYVIGIVHGLAGSAAVLFIILASTPNWSSGIVYLISFGLGTMVSMSLMTVVLSLPFALFSKSLGLGNTIISIAGALSIVLGLALAIDIAVGTTFTSVLWH